MIDNETIERFRKGDSAFSTWLYRVALNTCKDFLRRKEIIAKTHKKLEKKEMFENSENTIEATEVDTLLQNAINELPLEQREAFVLGPVEGKPYAEIADLLNCSVEAVKMRIYRARKSLVEFLGPYFEKNPVCN
ncbi:MAG: sigma-70 family RNA polymerase sigma factor [Planctomycetota bacterium]